MMIQRAQQDNSGAAASCRPWPLDANRSTRLAAVADVAQMPSLGYLVRVGSADQSPCASDLASWIAHATVSRFAYEGGKMSTYTINPRPEQGEWEVYVVGSDGVRQTMLGFPTEADAEAWIAGDKAREEPPQRRLPG
jgi:hypothetical protein